GNGAGKLLERAFTAADGVAHYTASADYQRFLNNYSKNCCDSTRFYPGVQALLSTFHKAGVSQGICTNKPYAITQSILQQLHIDSLFSAVIGGDSTARRKPDALPLTTCIDKLNQTTDSVLLVGDSAADVGAARACGVPVAVVPWGYSQTEAVLLGGDYLIDEPQQLLQLVIPAAGQ
ncbi:MAG: HAD-IA family hydrolase, partial [Pseudomonadota bacterium]